MGLSSRDIDVKFQNTPFFFLEPTPLECLIDPVRSHQKISLAELFNRERRLEMKLRKDLQPGNPFPDFKLPDQDGMVQKLSDLMGGWPTILVFWRGTY